MKKSALLFVFIFLVSYASFAQKANDMAYEKGNSTISLGYGIVNVWKSFLGLIPIPEYEVKSPGVFTFIYEYGITKRFSGGLAASYSRIRGKAERFQIADQLTIISVDLRANYHLWTNKKFDPYFGAGIGFNNSKYKNLDTHTVAVADNSKTPSTLDFSGQVGIKYFPIPHFGLYAEAGYVGGAIVHVGLTGRF